MKFASLFSLVVALFTSALALAAPGGPPPVTLAPGVTLELVPAGSGDGAFLVTPRPISKAQFEAFVRETSFRTEAERGTSGGFGYDPTTKQAVQRAGFSWRSPGFEQAPGDPVVDVTRDDALAFLAWASKKAGRALTLPSSARWEKAAAALPLPPAASKPGISVREWTSDTAPAAPGQQPRSILRGASWLQDSKAPDPAALTHESSPGSRKPDIGFRACAALPAAASAGTRAIAPPVPTATPTPAARTVDFSDRSTTTTTTTTATADAPVADALGAATPNVRPASVGRIILGLVFLLIPIAIFAFVVFLVIKIARSVLGQSRSTSSPRPLPAFPAPTPTGSGADLSATVVNGGIQLRSGYPAGTRIQVSWSGAPDGSTVVAYQPGPKGMFIPVAGVVQSPRASLATGATGGGGSAGVIPDAAVTPTADGFRVSGSMPDGTTVYATWTDASGAEQSGSARYEAASRSATFRTGQTPSRVAVAMRPLPASARLPENPPPAAVRAPMASSFGGSGRPMTVHSHRSDDGFWTGFWMSQMMHPSSSSYHSSTSRPLGSSFDNPGSSFDDRPGTLPGSTSLFGGNEPAAYH